MKDMSISKQRATDLVTAYGHSLDLQIVRQGSSLVCRDEELWKQVEVLLTDGDAQEMHCLGLDPLKVMEESLKAAAVTAAAPTAASTTRVKAKAGLQGLAKAFEVVEQAALNLYLSPWRKEYKVVKMYSGTFTHYIKPVLSMPQIENLFGLLGYQFSSSRHEQLRLQSPRVTPATFDNFLRLSCAFFLARCECRLLLTALGKYAGEAQWELSMVRERQRGNSLQVALDNTKKKLEVNQAPFEGDVDLYTDEQVNGGQRGPVISDESPRSLCWMAPSSAPPPTVKTHSNGVKSLSSSSTSPSTREDVHVSTFNCQLNKSALAEPDVTRSSAGVKQSNKHPCEASVLDKADTQSHSLQLEESEFVKRASKASQFCGCLQSSHICLAVCTQCNALHNITCALLELCKRESHPVLVYEFLNETVEELRAVSPQGGGTLPSLTSSTAAMSSLVLYDDPEPKIQSRHPIGYHTCCNLSQLDPQFLCLTCSVFHAASCRELDKCQMHTTRRLGVCSCGRTCSRNPLVLCRYCGNEFCRECWYRNPVECTCGQTFDQSSSV